MQRRRFLVKAGGALVAAGVTAAVQAPNVIAQPKFQWRMATSWPPSLDILQGTAMRFGKMVTEMSGGRLRVDVYAAGELMPALGVFDAVSKGSVEAFNSAPYYWAGKEPGMQWFSAVPFGLNAQGSYAWYHAGGGAAIMEEMYKAFDLVPRLGGSTGVQMGGWFRKRIDSLADYKGLKMRIPGLGGKVIAKAGGTVTLIAPGDVYTSLERGTIDATEMVAPHDDLRQGYQRVARYSYYPGWHENGTTVEMTFHRKAYEALPVDLQRIVDAAVGMTNTTMLAEYEMKNALGLQRLRAEFKDKVEVLRFPPEVMKELKRLAGEVNLEESERTPMGKKVFASYTKFQALIQDWGRISEAAYHSLVVG